MSPRGGDSRERMLSSAVDLLRERGASATTVDRVLARSGAPRGSVYHHFPGGRTQLLEEAVARAGDRMNVLIGSAAVDGDPVAAVDTYFAVWRERLVEHGFRSGCSIVAVAVETNDDAPQLARSAGAVFAGWQAAFADLLQRHGLSAARSHRLATLVVTAKEGAVVVRRAQRSPGALDAVAAEVHDLLVQALAG